MTRASPPDQNAAPADLEAIPPAAGAPQALASHAP